MKDVATACNVSSATVSRVLNNDPKVKKETAEYILKKIKELGYVPNAAGRSLRTEKTHTVLILLPTLSNQFFSKVIKGIEKRAAEDGYRIVIGITENTLERERQYINSVKMNIYDGVIDFLPMLPEEEYASVPVVFSGENLRDSKIPYVGIDNYRAGYDVTSRYISSGIRDIAFAGTYFKHESARLRYQSYINALSDNSIPVNEDYIFKDNYSFEAGVKAGTHFFSLKKPPKAIVTISDIIAAGIINYAISSGLKPGEDFSICGFDNTKLSEMYIPSITTVSQPRFEMGYMAMDLLSDIINKRKTNCDSITLNHEIIIRNT